jgi:hypothetical protein
MCARACRIAARVLGPRSAVVKVLHCVLLVFDNTRLISCRGRWHWRIPMGIRLARCTTANRSSACSHSVIPGPIR